MTHLRIGFDSQRGDAFSARLVREDGERRAPEPPLTDEDRKTATATARRSLTITRAWTRGALAVACAEHRAAPGVYCFRSRLSLVRGLCGARYAEGAERPTFARAEEPGLMMLAEAARNAERDARIREALLRRHPNRHPAAHVRAEVAR